MVFKRGADGSPRQILGAAHDISKRKQYEDAVRQGEAQKLALINAIPDLIFELNAGGVVLNIKLRAGMGSPFPPFEYIGRTLEQIYPAPLADQLILMVRHTLATGQPQVWEYESPFGGDSPLREARFVPIDLERVLIISRDITEIRKAEQTQFERERLRIALQKEQELSLLKSRMMTRISHEFRTPLSVILTSSELLWHYGERMTQQQRQEHFERVEDEIRNMSEILKSIAFIVQPQQRVLPSEACDLKQICLRLVEQIQSNEGAQHRLEVIADGDLHQTPADEGVLQRMISHLLLNAVRYSPAETTVCIELYRYDDHIALRVIDRGIGIPETDLSRIFEPFYRGSNVGEISGMGLGLTVVKHAVELHDGAISIESAVGEGTTVTIQLPTSA
jgi:signal transduction histidine kinase